MPSGEFQMGLAGRAMRVLCVTSLYPNRYQPNLAAFNRQQFASLATMTPMKVIAPVPWTVELAGRRRAAMAADHGGVDVEHTRYWFVPKVMRSRYGVWFRRSVAGAFARAVREFRPDVVLGAWAYPDGWAVGELAREHRLPVVIKVHGSDVLTIARGTPRWEMTVESLRKADGVVAVSEDLAAKVREMGADREKVRVVMNGVDTKLFCPGSMMESRRALGLDEQMPTVLYVGNLFPVKGVDVLVQACGVLRGQMPFVCYMVGAGFMRGKLQRQIAALGLEECVKLVGTRAHRELPAWFRAADVVVLPSRSEGVPNVLQEAAACGTRFVASRVGGVPEVAGLGEGRLVAAENVEELAGAMEASLRLPRDRCATRGAFRSHADSAAELLAALGTACGKNVPMDQRELVKL